MVSLFSFSFLLFLVVSCGKLSWLFVRFRAYINIVITHTVKTLKITTGKPLKQSAIWAVSDQILPYITFCHLRQIWPTAAHKCHITAVIRTRFSSGGATRQEFSFEGYSPEVLGRGLYTLWLQNDKKLKISPNSSLDSWPPVCLTMWAKRYCAPGRRHCRFYG